MQLVVNSARAQLSWLPSEQERPYDVVMLGRASGSEGEDERPDGIPLSVTDDGPCDNEDSDDNSLTGLDTDTVVPFHDIAASQGEVQDAESCGNLVMFVNSGTGRTITIPAHN